MANWFTQLYQVTRIERSLLSQYHDGLLCPTTGMVEPLRLELFSEQVNYYGLLIRTKKKPVAHFYRAEDNNKIEPRYWTADMQRVYDTAIKGNPVTSNSTISLWGKIVFVLILALLALLSYNILQWTGTITPIGDTDTIPAISSITHCIDSVAS